jgi:hypothetical protein
MRAVLCVAIAVGIAVPATVSIEPTQPEPTPTFDRSPAQGKPGRVINVSGTGCVFLGKPAERVVVSIGRLVAGGGPSFNDFIEVSVQPDGSWSGTYALPTTAPPGDYVMTSSCGAGDQVFGSSDQPFLTLNEPPAAVVAEPAQAMSSDDLYLAVSDCVFEDGTPATTAEFSVAGAVGTIVRADAPVSGIGASNITLMVPVDAPSGTYTAAATCRSGLGDLVAATATVVVDSRALNRTG